jgi:hypothetical protein
MSTKVSLVRDHPVTDQLPVYTAKATFTDGDDKTYTYHTKEVKDGVIILYKYDTDRVSTQVTKFTKTPIETEAGDQYNEKIPHPPHLTYHEKTEEKLISLETCKDFTILSKDTKEITYNNWSAVVDLPKEVALAYYREIGEDKCRIE